MGLTHFTQLQICKRISLLLKEEFAGIGDLDNGCDVEEAGAAVDTVKSFDECVDRLGGMGIIFEGEEHGLCVGDILAAFLDELVEVLVGKKLDVEGNGVVCGFGRGVVGVARKESDYPSLSSG